jgi:glycosyltransferase involved in cell wall biosynthesis
MVHSKTDWRSLEVGYIPSRMRVTVAAHGPYDQYSSAAGEVTASSSTTIAAVRTAPRPSAVNILFFGLIRPYKGLEDLLTVFNHMPKEEAGKFWLTVVGETWDGCIEPARLIQTSPHRDRITFVNKFVPDEVVAAAFGHADMVVLPYRRSSSSGTLHVAMSLGLPIVVTSVGGLPEAAGDYEGAVFVPPGDLDRLKGGITRASRMVGQRFSDPRSWTETVGALIAAADGRTGSYSAGFRTSEPAAEIVATPSADSGGLSA